VVTQVRAELRKLLGLPTAWAGLIIGTLFAPIIVLINAPATRRMIEDGALPGDVADIGLQDLMIGLIGPIVLGVVVVSSEYTSTGDDAPRARQLTATLTAMPHRMRLLAAKTVALVIVVFAQATIVAAATLGLTHALLGDYVPVWHAGRIAAAVLYWVLLALFSYAITLIARNGIVPLTLQIVNSTVVSVSYLLTKLTDLANYLPDIVGAHMFLTGSQFEVHIHPVVAGLTMSAWIAALLAIGAYLFQRRDA
jgi:ABC-type transport system involved in multi-copper enzyme maturation permease subunit